MTGQLSSRMLQTDESKFEIFQSNRRVYVKQRVDERAATQSITPTVKHGGGSVMVLRTFADSKVRDLHHVKDKLNQTRSTAYCSMMQSHLEFSL